MHRDRSPDRELAVFEDLVARDPTVLTRRVAFDFPRDAEDLRARLASAGLLVKSIEPGRIRFPCANGREVFDHLLRSGAGTVYRDALREDLRPALEAEFVRLLEASAARPLDVEHDYFTVVASPAMAV